MGKFGGSAVCKRIALHPQKRIDKLSLCQNTMTRLASTLSIAVFQKIDERVNGFLAHVDAKPGCQVKSIRSGG